MPIRSVGHQQSLEPPRSLEHNNKKTARENPEFDTTLTPKMFLNETQRTFSGQHKLGNNQSGSNNLMARTETPLVIFQIELPLI